MPIEKWILFTKGWRIKELNRSNEPAVLNFLNGDGLWQ